MPATQTQTKSIHLVGGDDEFTIKETAAKLVEKLAPKKAGDFGLEIVEGDAANQDEALKILARLDEALNTIGLFGGEKVVWLKSTSLLGDNPTTRAEAVKDALTDLAEALKRGVPDGVTLLISAIGCDQRRTLYKTIAKLGDVRLFSAPEEGRGHGDEEIAEFIQTKLRAERKTMSAAAIEVFRERVAPDFREMANELEKLFVYVGKRNAITDDDVRAICSESRQAIIWELTDTLGARNLPAAVATLEKLLDGGDSAIGVVIMLANQFRLMLLMRDLMQRKLINASDGQGGGFTFVKAFERLTEEHTAHFPRTKEGKLPSAWRLYRCALAAKNFPTSEIVRSLDLLLRANLQLVSTQLDERLVLEEAIAKIALKLTTT